jgi:hypothetical protein
MQVNLKVRQLIFAEQGLCLKVQHMHDGSYTYYSIADLFFNDDLLAEFNYADIRLICYFAAVNEYELDSSFLKKIRRSKRFKKSMTQLQNPSS